MKPVNIRLRMKAEQPALNGALRKVGEWFLNTVTITEAANMTRRQMAESCYVSEATITRYIGILGYRSFVAFKRDFCDYMEDEVKAISIYGNRTGDEPPQKLCQLIFDDNIAAVNKTLEILKPADVEKAAELLRTAGKITVVGQGRSALAADSLAVRLVSLGLYCSSLHDASLQYMNAASFGSRDVLVVFSMSGMVRSAVVCAGLAKKRGAKIINFTGSIDTPITEIADVNLRITSEMPDEKDHSFSTALFILAADILFMKIYSSTQDT